MIRRCSALGFLPRPHLPSPFTTRWEEKNGETVFVKHYTFLLPRPGNLVSRTSGACNDQTRSEGNRIVRISCLEGKRKVWSLSLWGWGFRAKGKGKNKDHKIPVSKPFCFCCFRSSPPYATPEKQVGLVGWRGTLFFSGFGFLVLFFKDRKTSFFSSLPWFYGIRFRGAAARRERVRGELLLMID